MQINVSQLMQEPVGSTRDYDIETVTQVTDEGKECLIRGKAHLMRMQSSLLVKCNIKTEVELSCVRCLNKYLYPMKLRFEEEYFPVIDVLSGKPVTGSGEPGVFYIDEHHIVDLTEAIRQYASLAIPMKPLCNENCVGLCSHCGHNLNKGRCQCAEENIDPRWSELAKLLQNTAR